jgi:hypothetical protein
MVAVQILGRTTDTKALFLPGTVLGMVFYRMNYFIFQWDEILI